MAVHGATLVRLHASGGECVGMPVEKGEGVVGREKWADTMCTLSPWPSYFHKTTPLSHRNQCTQVHPSPPGHTHIHTHTQHTHSFTHKHTHSHAHATPTNTCTVRTHTRAYLHALPPCGHVAPAARVPRQLAPHVGGHDMGRVAVDNWRYLGSQTVQHRGRCCRCCTSWVRGCCCC